MNTVAELKKEQYSHIAAHGGYMNLKEADKTNNDLNREQIEAFKQENGTAYLGSINYYGEQREAIADGSAPVYEEFTGQMVYNFSCAFCVPTEDKDLEDLIRGWNADIRTATVCQITNRISSLGGLIFVWS